MLDQPEATEFAVLRIGDQEIQLPIIVGTEGERGIDISNLRKYTGCVTIDPSFVNTAACYSLSLIHI